MNRTRRALLAGSALLALSGAACGEQISLYRPEFNQIFQQVPAAQVDILLVVDNSCSMFDEQAKLAEGFDQFISFFEFADVDYQIGVITTDMDDGSQAGRLQGNPRIITPETEDAATVFANNVRVGTDGAPYEQGLRAAQTALGDSLLNGHNAGFVRPEASLSVIFVSDEEDGSLGPVADFINDLRAVKGERNRDAFNASAIIGMDEAGERTADCGQTIDPNAGAIAAYRYEDVVVNTGGLARSICADDFGPLVTDLGLNSSRLQDSFPLDREPDVETMDITLVTADEELDISDGVDYPWEVIEDELVDGGSGFFLVFPERLPPPNSQLIVRYESGRVRDDGEE